MRAAALCMGIGGLDLAVERHFGAELAWCAEYEAAPSTVIARHWPGVPNYGDLTAIEWDTVPPVDILTAGYPCQPFSHAGKRKGTDDHRHLWPYIAEAVRVLRPRVVVLENVAGHLSLGFGTVLGDLAEAGFDAEWCVLRASDVGAPHQRARVFIVARNTDSEGLEGRRSMRGRGGQRSAGPSGMVPAPHSRGERHGGGQDGGAVGRVDRGDAGEARQRERARPLAGDRGHAAPADAGSQRLDGRAGIEGAGRHAPERSEAGDHARDGSTAWGKYAPAIHRWGAILGRPAPAPTDDAGRLSPRFVEWMMGYPEGWVDGLTRTQALKALGNAVVTQQALAALAELCPVVEVAA